jgi:glucose/arabinose dehydrogenase
MPISRDGPQQHIQQHTRTPAQHHPSEEGVGMFRILDNTDTLRSVRARLARRATPVFCLSLTALVLLAAGVAPRAADAATLPTGFVETRLASGLQNPTAMALAPDGRIFVAEQSGKLRVIKDGALLATPFVDLTSKIDSQVERGLVGVAVDPDFASNKYVYVYYTATAPALHNRISRFTANGDVAASGETSILDLPDIPVPEEKMHNGGALRFGTSSDDEKRKLYVAVGDHYRPWENAQKRDNPFGKILRINKDGTIPTDNPFYPELQGVNRAIWAYGLRNPFTFDIERGTGRMFINDVGNHNWEEISEGKAGPTGATGPNFGWNLREGLCKNGEPSNCRTELGAVVGGQTDPIFVYAHGKTNETGCAITGGAFYNPPTQQFPSIYVGKYFFADYCQGWIRLLDPATKTASDFARDIASPVDLRVDSDGSLYYLSRGDGQQTAGSVWRIQYNTGQKPAIVQQPEDLRLAVNEKATFEVSASGSPPLQYQWQRNNGAGWTDISGATSASYTISAVIQTDNGARFRCRVSNTHDVATSNAATLTVVKGGRPQARIDLPIEGTLYRAGDTVSYSGTGTDEGQSMPASAFTWWVVFHHADHTHPFILPPNPPATSGTRSGSFVIPRAGETDDDVWYRIYLKVRDADGLEHTTYRDVRPRKMMITVATSPPGLQVVLDSETTSAPISRLSVVGIERTLGAVSPQTLGTQVYSYSHWSHGGSAMQTIITPEADHTYTVVYREGIRLYTPLIRP